MVSSALPGVSNLTSLAADNTARLLSGMPTTSAARKSNAVFGAGSGLAPGSDFLKTRLYDTFGQQVENRNQLGLQNFLALLSGTSGPALAENAQNNQVSQFGQTLAEQKAEFADRLKQQQEQFNAQHDLELQKFGFDRSRYFKPTGPAAISNVSSAVPGAGEANYRIDQTNAAHPEWWS